MFKNGAKSRKKRRAFVPAKGRFTGFSVVICLLSCVAMLSPVACRRSLPEPQPPADGYYRLPLTDNPVTLDPAKFTGVDSEGVAGRIFNTLVTLDADLKPIPEIAEKWVVSGDGRTYTFTLRRGVRFHNGREMIAEDVRYSFERLLRRETVSRRAWVVEPIAGADDLREGSADSLKGLEVVDQYTVRITLAAPFPPILSQLAMTNAAVIPREEVEKKDVPFGRRPVGTGPFRFVTWKDNDVIELARNEDYFDGPPALAGIRFRVIKEPVVAYHEYRAGNLEHCAVPEGSLNQIRSGSLRGELRSVATLSTYYLGIMMTHDPAGKNLHLRRALNYAVDREFLCEKVLGGTHMPAKGVLPPGLPSHDPGLEGYAADPQRARHELDEAGFGPENPVPELTLYCKNSQRTLQVAQVIQNDLQRIGIKASVRALDFGALKAAINKAEPDLFYLSWIADFPDADNFLQIFHSARHGPPGNRVRYTNTEVDALLDQSRREVDREKRTELLRRAEAAIVHDAPWIFLSHGQTHLLVKPYVRGFELGPMDVGTSVNQVAFHKISFASTR